MGCEMRLILTLEISFLLKSTNSEVEAREKVVPLRRLAER